MANGGFEEVRQGDIPTYSRLEELGEEREMMRTETN